MKKILMGIMVAFMILIVGCSDNEGPQKNAEKEKDNTYEGTPLEEGEEKEDLTLIVPKVDKDEGVTIENNELYTSVQEVVDEDPKSGDHDDLSFAPLDVIEFEDDDYALAILIINRLNKPIKNIAFNMELGNTDGELVIDEEVDLDSDFLGELGVNETTPFYLDVDEEQIELFYTLSEENLHLVADEFKMDFVE